MIYLFIIKQLKVSYRVITAGIPLYVEGKGERFFAPFSYFKAVNVREVFVCNAFSIIALLFLTLILSYCTSVPRFTSRDERYRRESKTQKEDLDRYKNSEVLETAIGTASYYADQFNNKITYSGEVYDMFGLSAAHPTYQMGTIIRVTNLSNDKTVIIRVNDRMPYRPDRIIDLSLGCAQELDMVQVGITMVKVEVLEWGTGKK